MAKPKLTMDPKKVRPTETPDGELTEYGLAVAYQYASIWIDGWVRDLDMERAYPELEHLFQDIRVDPELCTYHAMPLE